MPPPESVTVPVGVGAELLLPATDTVTVSDWVALRVVAEGVIVTVGVVLVPLVEVTEIVVELLVAL